MESENPLSQLADIHLPDPVSIWPLAPGWWVLIVLALLGLAWLGYRALRRLVMRKRLQAAQRELLKAIEAYRARTRESTSDHNQAGLDYLYAVNAVLNRVALYTDSSRIREIARLSGAPWLEYLDRTYGGEEFTQGAGKVLAEGQYRPVFAGEIEALYTLAQRWIASRYTGSTGKAKADKADNSHTMKVLA